MSIRDTWKKQIPPSSLFRFVCDKLTDDLLYEERQYKDILFLNTTEIGQARKFGEKLKILVQHSLQTYNFDVFLRIDDDNYLCVEHLLHDINQVFSVTNDFLWGWWFGPSMLMNVSPDTHGLNSDAIGQFCGRLNGLSNAKYNWRPDEMGIIVSSSILKKIFNHEKYFFMYTHDLMDVTLTKWMKNMNVTYIVDNARFVRGQGRYDKKLSSHIDAGTFCNNHISFHKAHPNAMKQLWQAQPYTQEHIFEPLKIHHNCFPNMGTKSQQIPTTLIFNTTSIIPPSFNLNNLNIKNSSKIYIDVGTYFLTEFKNILLNDPDAIVIGFEPTLKTYKIHKKNLSHPRLKLFNAAISPNHGFMEYYVNEKGAHCNSLKKRNDAFISPEENNIKLVIHCQKKGIPVQVPTVPLDYILKNLSSVEFLKIDAQGFDFEVLQTASLSLKKIKKIKVECQDVGIDFDLLLYTNVSQCPDIMDWMYRHQWYVHSKSPSNIAIKEFDVIFLPIKKNNNQLLHNRKLQFFDKLEIGDNLTSITHSKVKTFGNDEQKMLYRLLRSTYRSKMYPLDVKSPKDFHSDPRWGAKRGQPIGRYYLHRWLEKIDDKYKKFGQKRCLEIGDGHFIKANIPRAWKQRQGKMLSFCSDDSLSLDLVDSRADLHANLESPLETLKEKTRSQELTAGFDVIICLQVFEHVDYPVDAMIGLASLLRHGGIVLFSVPFIASPIHGHDVHRFTKTGVTNLAKKAGLKVLSNKALGNSLTTIGYLLELSADDFTENELLVKDDHQYVGVYSILQK
tara:strand:+ start:1931 stop:4288 length:2358 start_codon:yes stop_codon:yes gene_type:complete